VSVAQFKLDMSEVRSLAADMTRVESTLSRHLIPVVRKGGVNIKKAMQEDLRKSSNKGFRKIAGTVSFDEIDGGFGVEVGPGAGGELENIAYFGSYKGGGTVRDPYHALEDEYPNFIKHLGEIAAELILGD